MAQYIRADAPAWTWDPDFKRILWGNDDAATFWGEPVAVALPDKWFAPLDKTAQAFSVIAKTSALNETAKISVPLDYQGASVEILCEVTPFEQADGRRALFVAPVMPIQTASKAAETSFDIADVLPQVIATFTREGHLLHQNAVAKEIFGTFSSLAEESSPMALSYWLGGEHLAYKFIAMVMATGSHSMLQQVQTRFGQRLYRIHAKRLDQANPKSPAFVVTFMDAGSQILHVSDAPSLPPIKTAIETPASVQMEAVISEPVLAPAVSIPEVETVVEAPVPDLVPEESVIEVFEPELQLEPKPIADIPEPIFVEEPVVEEPASPEPETATETEDTQPEVSEPVKTPAVSPLLEAMAPADKITQEPAHVIAPPLAPDFLWKMDVRTRLIEISAGIEAVVGLAPSELLDKTWVSLCDQYGIDFDGKIDRLIGTRAPWSETILWPIEEDGVLAAVEIELSAKPVTTDSGKFAGFMGSGRALVSLSPDTSEIDAPFDNVPASSDEPTADTSSLELTEEEQRAFRALGNELAQSDGLTPLVNDDVSTDSVAHNDNATNNGARVDIDAPAAVSSAPETSSAPRGHDLIKALEIALDDAPLCYLVHRNFHILYANTATAHLFGFASSEAMVKDPNLLNLFPNERALLFEWQTKFDDEIAGSDNADRNLDLTGRKADQLDVDIKAAVAPIPLEDGYAVQMVLSERSLNAESLRESQRREIELRTILDTATDGIATLDEDGRIVTLNKSAEAIFGLNQSDVLGRRFANLLEEKSTITVDDYLSGLSDNSLATIFNDGREVVAIENKGGHIPLFLTIGKMPDGNPTKFCAVMRDITQWKKAEENLKQAIEVAETASTQKSDFLAKISHELRTPLNSIIGFSEIIAQEQFGPLENERYLGYINDIHASGNHLLSLINDLLDLSKVEAGKLELDFVAVNLNDIIMKSVNSMQNSASRERIVIRSALSSSLPSVVADERSCTQIVLNLLSNAIKFTDGGGQVIVSSSLEESGEVKISVRDTGVGMSEKDIERALEPFRQITTSSTGSAVGTGLGLPLTKALAEANRARFRIESKPQTGTLVEITFPTARVLAD